MWCCPAQIQAKYRSESGNKAIPTELGAPSNPRAQFLCATWRALGSAENSICVLLRRCICSFCVPLKRNLKAAGLSYSIPKLGQRPRGQGLSCNRAAGTNSSAITVPLWSCPLGIGSAFTRSVCFSVLASPVSDVFKFSSEPHTRLHGTHLSFVLPFFLLFFLLRACVLFCSSKHFCFSWLLSFTAKLWSQYLLCCSLLD